MVLRQPLPPWDTTAQPRCAIMIRARRWWGSDVVGTALVTREVREPGGARTNFRPAPTGSDDATA